MGYSTMLSERTERARHDADNWQRYEGGVGSSKSVQCIKHDSSDVIVVLCGNLDHRLSLARKHAPGIERDKLAMLLNGKLKKVACTGGIWRRGTLPSATTLRDRQSIATLPAANRCALPCSNRCCC